MIALATILFKEDNARNSVGGVTNSSGSGSSEVISPHTTIQQSLGGVRPVETPPEELDPMNIREGSVTYGDGKTLAFYQWQVKCRNPRVAVRIGCSLKLPTI